MSDQPLESEVLDIVNLIGDKKRADALDKISDILYAKASQSMDDYKKVVADTFFDEPTQKKNETNYRKHQDIQILSEEKDGKKHLYIEGVFLQSEIKNRNGRIYPLSVLEKEVGRYNEEYIKTGRALGELGHPDGPCKP